MKHPSKNRFFPAKKHVNQARRERLRIESLERRVLMDAALGHDFSVAALATQAPVANIAAYAQLSPTSALSKVALNPQPLPPKVNLAMFEVSAFSKLSQVSLNPQPLPPKVLSTPATNFISNGVAQVALNPQPLPPKELAKALDASFDKLGNASLNPQPLPPRESGALASVSYSSKINAVSLNPQPLPPKISPAVLSAVKVRQWL